MFGRVRSGDFVYIHPRYVMTHDNTMAVMKKFKVMGISRIANPGQLVFTLDHNVQDRTEKNLQKYREIEIFAKEQGVTFFPAGRGIGHQVICLEKEIYLILDFIFILLHAQDGFFIHSLKWVCFLGYV